VKTLKHVNVTNSRTIAHVFHCPGTRDATRKHQPIEDVCLAKMFRISYVAVKKKTLILSMNQSVIGLLDLLVRGLVHVYSRKS